MRKEILRRSAANRKLCGVCGGIAEYFGWDVKVVRLAWVLLTLMSHGTGILFYILAAVLMEKAQEI